MMEIDILSKLNKLHTGQAFKEFGRTFGIPMLPSADGNPIIAE